MDPGVGAVFLHPDLENPWEGNQDHLEGDLPGAEGWQPCESNALVSEILEMEGRMSAQRRLASHRRPGMAPTNTSTKIGLTAILRQKTAITRTRAAPRA
jgi:hypothetical protein